MSSTGLAIPETAESWETGEVLFGPDVIAKRVGELAREIDREYRKKPLTVIGVLSGAFPFMCDLVRELKTPLSMDFIAISRCRADFNLREVEIVHDIQEEIEGRHVLLIDDIVDTGLSLHFVISELKRRGPASLAAASLLARPELCLVNIPLHYVGFNVLEEFLVGYGLDYRGRYRDLPYIAVLQPRIG